MRPSFAVTVFITAISSCRSRRPRADLPFECRPAQVLQVLVNLLNNAFDAIQNNTEKWVRLGVEDAGDQLVISVTDSGKGIPSETAQQTLQAFFTTKPPGKGTGLGLSLSREIAESHHGSLTIDTKKPNTCFVLRLPKKQAAVGHSHPPPKQPNTFACRRI